MAAFSDLTDTMFAVRDSVLVAMGFERLNKKNGDSFSTLWINPKYAPGLLFKKVPSALNAVAFGGIAAFSENALYLIADQVTERLRTQRWGTLQDWNVTFEKGNLRYHSDVSDGLGYYNPSIRAVPGDTREDEIVGCLAIVTPCSMVGNVKFNPSFRSQRIFFVAGSGVTLSIDSGGGHSQYDTGLSYILQWRIMPWANNCQLRLKPMQAAIVAGYPEDAREDLNKSFTDQAAKIYQGRAQLNLFHLRRFTAGGGGEATNQLGFMPRNAARRSGKVANLYDWAATGLSKKTDSDFNFIVPGLELPISREVDGRRIFSGFVDPVLTVAMNTADIKGKLNVMGYEADSEKLLRDFWPVTTKTYAEGTTVFATEAEKIDPSIDAQDPNQAYDQDNVPNQNLAAWPAGPDAFVEMYNWAVRAEMQTAKGQAIPRPNQAIFAFTDENDKPYDLPQVAAPVHVPVPSK